MALVLCTGIHPPLVRTRKMILERAGHTVITARNSSAVAAACQRHQFDVAVLGQSSTPALKHEWLSIIRTYCPSAKVLELYVPCDGSTLPDADDRLEAPAIPDHLAEH